MKDKANDELRDLWTLSPSGSLSGPELIALVQKDVQRRDIVRVLYILVAVLCIPLIALSIFLAAVGALSTLQRIGSICTAASGVLLAFCLIRYIRAAIPVDPHQNLAAYTQAMIQQCNRQIRFFKSAKYVYLLPLSIGILISKAGSLMYRAKPGPLRWVDVVDVATSIMLLGFLWGMYQVLVPWATRKERDKLLAMIGEKDQQ
jgi:hypothetical protein